MFSCKTGTPDTSSETTVEAPSETIEIQSIQSDDGIRSFLTISDFHLDIESDSIALHRHEYIQILHFGNTQKLKS